MGTGRLPELRSDSSDCKSLRDAVENKPEGREGMALGQYVTGMAFSNVGLGIAHSMAHTLGAVYDAPHGVACAMMLPIVMEYNAECSGEKYREQDEICLEFTGICHIYGRCQLLSWGIEVLLCLIPFIVFDRKTVYNNSKDKEEA